mgnify:CR=1 FL=1
MLKKITATLLLLCLGLSFFAGCGGTSDDIATVTEKQTADTTAIDEEAGLSELDKRRRIPDELPEIKFAGREFRVACEEAKSYEILSEELIGEVTNDVIYDRNVEICERFDSAIKNVVVTNAHDHVVTTVLAGDDAYDIIGYKAYLVYKSVQAKVVTNFYDLPYINLEKPWYNQITNDAATFYGKLFAATCSLGISAMQYTYAMFANQRLVEAHGYPVTDIYGMVYDNEWVYDKFLEIVSTVYTDVNGDGKKDIDDVYGYMTGNTHPLDAWLPAFDQNITSRDSNDEIVINVMSEKTVQALEKIYDLTYNNPSAYYSPAEYKEFDQFSYGKVAIAPMPFKVCYDKIRDMDDNYAVLPYPKWDENQEMFLTNIYDQYSVFSIPKTVYGDDAYEFVGVMLEGLNAVSYKDVYPAYYDIALKDKYTTDADSAAMVDIVMEGSNMDFSFMFGETDMQRIPYIFRDCINGKKLDIASEYANKETALATSIPKIYEYYKEG